jgi:hypothetical protein
MNGLYEVAYELAPNSINLVLALFDAIMVLATGQSDNDGVMMMMW